LENKERKIEYFSLEERDENKDRKRKSQKLTKK
jgi:hypothetical protein